MTEDQEKLLQEFKHILLLHSEPENIVNRLSKNLFIKAPLLDKKVTELKAEDIKSFL